MPSLAREIMETTMLTIPADMGFREVQHLLVVAGVHGGVVVDDAGGVVGVLSALDVLRAADQAADEDEDEGEEDAEGAGDVLATLTARDLATFEVVWVPPDMPAREIARTMRKEGIHRVLVGTNGRLEGVVTTHDLLRLLES